MNAKVFVSIPMHGLSYEEIKTRMSEARSDAERILGKEVVLIDSVFEYFDNSNPVEMLGRAIQAMSLADYVYFGVGWKNARGCRAEHMIAVSYGMSILHENMEALNG